MAMTAAAGKTRALLAAFLLFCLAGRPRAETDEAPATVSTVPAAAQLLSAAPPPYEAAIRGLMKRLSALLEKGGLVDRRGLDGAAAEIAALDARLAALLGPDILRGLDEREKEGRARSALMEFRTGLLAYYGDNDGKYPASPAELAPRDLPAVPKAELPGHPATDAILLHQEAAGGPAEAVTDEGGWLYFSNPKSRRFGLLILNCSHKDSGGNEFYGY